MRDCAVCVCVCVCVRERERERERERDAKPAFRNDGTAKTDTPPERKGDSGEMIEQLK